MATKQETEDARRRLRELLPPGETAYTVLRHVSRSGMTRAISVVKDDQDISWLVVRAVPGFQFDQRHGGIRIGGCGMDMGFSIVYTLSRTLYPNGHACTNERRCPSNDHLNEREPNYSSRFHSDGGYAIRQAWL